MLEKQKFSANNGVGKNDDKSGWYSLMFYGIISSVSMLFVILWDNSDCGCVSKTAASFVVIGYKILFFLAFLGSLVN